MRAATLKFLLFLIAFALSSLGIVWIRSRVFGALNPSRKAVFVIGQGRTGSTLIGDLFNKREDFIYFFEPLRAVELYLNQSYFRLKNAEERATYGRVARKFLYNLVHCKLDKFDDGILKFHEFGQFRYRSKKLTEAPFCTQEGCTPLSAFTLNQYCQENPQLNIVIKELEFRIPDADITELWRYYYRVFVLHLVRDPRAFLSSVRKLQWFSSYHADVAKRENTFLYERCRETRNNIIRMQTIFKIDSAFSTENYKILRYEDLAVSDVAVRLGLALSIFTGTDFTNTVASFMKDRNTDKVNTSAAADPYSIYSRRISDSIRKWREEGDRVFISKVEHYCGELMTALGYEKAQW